MDLELGNTLISLLAVVVAVATFVIGFLSKRRIDKRLLEIEVSRDAREAEQAERERRSLELAEVRVAKLTMPRPGRSGESDGFRVTLTNRGQATARDVVCSIRTSGFDMYGAAHRELGLPMAPEIDGFIRIDAKTEPDVESLPSGESVSLFFWHRMGLDAGRFRITWADAHGEHLTDQTIDLTTD